MWHWISSIADKRWFMFTPHWNPSRWNKTKKFHWWTKCKQVTSRQTNTLHIKSTGWWHDEHLEIVGTHKHWIPMIYHQSVWKFMSFRGEPLARCLSYSTERYVWSVDPRWSSCHVTVYVMYSMIWQSKIYCK